MGSRPLQTAPGAAMLVWHWLYATGWSLMVFHGRPGELIIGSIACSLRLTLREQRRFILVSEQLLTQRREDVLGWDVLSAVTSRYGQVRLGRVRDYVERVDNQKLELLERIYKTWVLQDEWLLLQGTHFRTGEVQRAAVKCSKRGNDVFNRRLDRKLGFLSRLQLNKKDFFSLDDFTPHKRVMASWLWVTLTYDSKRCSLDEAWRTVSADFNRWITNLRNEYGRILVCKFVQAFPDRSGKAYGYPHYHMILYFQDANFQVFPRWERAEDGSEELAFRIEEKEEVAAQGKWHSFIDVKALKSISAAVNYCRKYGQGTYDVVSAEGAVNEEAMVNCTMNWYFRKQTYALSRSFHGALSDLIRTLQGSKTLQCCLDGSAAFSEWKWEFLGVRSLEELGKVGFAGPPWSFSVEDAEAWDRLVRRDYQRRSWEID
jgi:hypothetical protein